MAHVYWGSIMLLSTGVNASNPVVQAHYRSAHGLVQAVRTTRQLRVHFGCGWREEHMGGGSRRLRSHGGRVSEPVLLSMWCRPA